MDYDNWLEEAKKRTEKLLTGTIFILKDLFQGVEWNRLEKGQKLHFGRVFKNAVIHGEIPKVCFLKKAENNSAQYKKY